MKNLPNFVINSLFVSIFNVTNRCRGRAVVRRGGQDGVRDPADQRVAVHAAEGRGHVGVPSERRPGTRGADGDEVLRPAQPGRRDRQGSGRFLNLVFLIFVFTCLN